MTSQSRLQTDRYERHAVDADLVPGDPRTAIRSGPGERVVRADGDVGRIREDRGRRGIDVERRRFRNLRVAVGIRRLIDQDVTTIREREGLGVCDPGVPVDAVRDRRGDPAPACGGKSERDPGEGPSAPAPGAPRGPGAPPGTAGVTRGPGRV